MKRVLALATLLSAGAAFLLPSQDADPERVRRKLKDDELVGRWIYDDAEAGFREAAESGKPILLVFRCVP